MGLNLKILACILASVYPSGGGAATLRQVTTRASYDNVQIGGAFQVDCASTIQAKDDITGLGVSFINAFSYLETSAGTSTWKVVYEYNGQLATINWSSSGGSTTTGTTGTAVGAVRINSDWTAFGFTIPKGAWFKRRIYATNPTGVCVARGNMTARTFDASIDRFNYSNTTTPSIDNSGLSKAAYDALGTNQTSNAYLYLVKPAAEWSLSNIPAVALLGDSRMCGESGDIPNAPYYLMEHGERIVGAKYAYSNFGASGEKGMDWANPANAALRKSVVNDYFQIVVNAYGTNDLGNATSVAYLTTMDQNIKALPSSQGKLYWRFTTPPKLAGNPADLFTSYTGQSLATGDNHRIGHNAAIMANADGLYDRVFDESAVFSDTTTGKIKIYPNARVVTGGINNTTGLITLATGTLTAGDNGHNIQAKQADGWVFPETGSGTTFATATGIGLIQYVSATTCYITTLNGTIKKPNASVAGPINIYIGGSEPSADGVHYGRWLNELLESTLQIPA